MKIPMRKSQQVLFWRDHKVIEIRKEGKILGWFGIRIPQTAQKIIEKV